MTMAAHTKHNTHVRVTTPIASSLEALPRNEEAIKKSKVDVTAHCHQGMKQKNTENEEEEMEKKITQNGAPKKNICLWKCPFTCERTNTLYCQQTSH
jgi:hypothetical protein